MHLPSTLLIIPVHVHINAIIQSSNHVAAVQGSGQVLYLLFTTNVKEKCDFDYKIVVDARCTGLNIS